jgi:hypothetical protein
MLIKTKKLVISKLLALNLLLLKKRRLLKCKLIKSNKRRCWETPIFSSRPAKGYEDNILPELLKDEIYKLKDLIKIDEHLFNFILEKLTPRLQRKSHRAISPKLKLILTLKFLSTGTCYRDLS